MDEENKKTTPTSDEENKTEVKEVQEVTPKAEEKPEEKSWINCFYYLYSFSSYRWCCPWSRLCTILG